MDDSSPTTLSMLLTIAEAAKQLHCSRKTITKLIRRGKIAAVDIDGTTNVDRAEVVRFIAEWGGR